MSLPGKSDIDDGSLDGAVALEQFLGKNQGEAQEMFHKNASACTESLMWMPEPGALFYGRALAKYVASERARGNIEAASGLITAAEHWAEAARFGLDPIAEDLCAALHRVHEHFAFFANDGISQRIYRDTPKRAKHLLWLLAQGRRT